MFLTFFMFLLCSLLNISRVFWKRFLRYILPLKDLTEALLQNQHLSQVEHRAQKLMFRRPRLKKTDKGEIVRKNHWKNRWTKLKKWWKDEKTVFSCRCPCCLPVCARFQIHQGLDQGPARPNPRPSAMPKCVAAPSWQHVCGNKMICQILHMAAFILKNICIL